MSGDVQSGTEEKPGGVLEIIGDHSFAVGEQLAPTQTIANKGDDFRPFHHLAVVFSAFDRTQTAANAPGMLHVFLNGQSVLDNTNSSAGAAYVFLRSGVTWAQTAYLKAPNNDSFDQFGVCVAASLNTVAAGANYESANDTTVINGPTGSLDNSNSGAGATYVIFH